MIHTDRLILRQWRDTDVMPFHAMGQDKDVMRYLGPPMDVASCQATVTAMNAMAHATDDCLWAVERRADGMFLGFCGIQPGPRGTPIMGQPEIGWRLSRAAWGQGIAREAAAACLDRAWRRGATRVHAVTVKANSRSWGLMIRLGMTRVAGGDFRPTFENCGRLPRHLRYMIDRPAA